jgi:hypothetical protein
LVRRQVIAFRADSRVPPRDDVSSRQSGLEERPHSVQLVVFQILQLALVKILGLSNVNFVSLVWIIWVVDGELVDPWVCRYIFVQRNLIRVFLHECIQHQWVFFEALWKLRAL